MKKITRTQKLELNKQTRRRIASDELGKVAGATPTHQGNGCWSCPPASC